MVKTVIERITVTVDTGAGPATFDLDVPPEWRSFDEVGLAEMSDALQNRFQRAIVTGDLDADRWRL